MVYRRDLASASNPPATVIPASLALPNLATAARVVVHGGQGADAAELALTSYEDRGWNVLRIEARELVESEELVAQVAELARTAPERTMVVVSEGTPALVTDEEAFEALDDAAGEVALVVCADVPAPEAWTKSRIGLSLDAGGHPTAAIRQAVGDDTEAASAWVDASDGWLCAARVAGQLRSRFGSELCPDPETWLQARCDRGPTLAEQLEASWDLLGPEAQELLTACVQAAPVFSGQGLAKMCAQRGVHPSTLDRLTRSGWLQEARTPRRTHWWLPWLRAHWLLASLDLCPDSTWGVQELTALCDALVDDLAHERRLEPAELALLSRLTTWVPTALPPPPLLRGAMALCARQLVDASLALERAWWEAHEAQDVRTQSTASLLLAEAFARRDDIDRARRYLKTARPSVGSDNEVAHRFLDFALAPADARAHAERRLRQLMASLLPSRWLPMAQLALDLLTDGDRFEAHARLVGEVDRALTAPGDAWLHAHRALALIWSVAGTTDAIKQLRQVPPDDPVGRLARTDLCLLGADQAAAEQCIAIGLRDARRSGLPASELAFSLRQVLLYHATGRAALPATIQGASVAARKLGRSDVRDLMSWLAHPGANRPRPRQCSPLVRAIVEPPVLRDGDVLGPPVDVRPLCVDQHVASWMRGAHDARDADPDPALLDVGPSTLVLDSALRWAVVAEQPPVDLRRLALYARLLERLVEARGTAPGESVHLEDVIEALWPDERMSFDSAHNRLHKTLSTFRKKVSRELLDRVDDGYRIPPQWRIVVLSGRLVTRVCDSHQAWHHDATGGGWPASTRA